MQALWNMYILCIIWSYNFIFIEIKGIDKTWDNNSKVILIKITANIAIFSVFIEPIHDTCTHSQMEKSK